MTDRINNNNVFYDKLMDIKDNNIQQFDQSMVEHFANYFVKDDGATDVDETKAWAEQVNTFISNNDDQKARDMILGAINSQDGNGNMARNVTNYLGLENAQATSPSTPSTTPDAPETPPVANTPAQQALIDVIAEQLGISNNFTLEEVANFYNQALSNIPGDYSFTAPEGMPGGTDVSSDGAKGIAYSGVVQLLQ